MSLHSRAIRSTGDFRVADGRILLSRLGSANAQRQRHNHTPRDMRTGQRLPWDGNDPYESKHPAPVGRGYWAFPYPFGDAFFYCHVYERHLPKALRTDEIVSRTQDDLDLRTRLWGEQERCLSEIRERVKMKLVWHQGPFYAQIRPKSAYEPRMWWRYDNAREYVEQARRTFTRDTCSDDLKTTYCSDILQVFVPAGGANAKRSFKVSNAPSVHDNVLEDDFI